jgi:hypothetical protein
VSQAPTELVTHSGVVATSAAYGLPAGYMSALADENKLRIARAAGFMVDLATVSASTAR